MAMAGTQVTTSTALETGPLQYSRVKVCKMALPHGEENTN